MADYYFAYTPKEKLEKDLKRAVIDKGFLEKMVALSRGDEETKPDKAALSNYENQLRKQEEYIRALEEELYRRLWTSA